MKKEIHEPDMCDDICEHPLVVSRVIKDMIPDEEAQQVTEMFRMLGDMTRFKILFALSKQELCVCDIAKVVQMAQSGVSHQLRLLRGARMVKYRKEGTMAWYSLKDESIGILLQHGLDHIRQK